MYENLLYENESDALDFKSEQYKFINEEPRIKGELLKDILAFANSWRRVNAVILIGVKEIKGQKAEVIGISGSDLDDAQLQEFINSKTNIPIDFSYKTINLEGENIGVIDIQHQQRPVFLTKDYGKLKKNSVYLRRGSSTVIAKPNEIADMGHQESKDAASPVLNLEFCNLDEGKTIGRELNLNAELIDASQYRDIPGFKGNSHYVDNIYNVNVIKTELPNSNYYKKLFLYYYVQKKKNDIYFGIQNSSGILATGIVVYLEIEKSENINIIYSNKLPKLIEKYSSTFPHYNIPEALNTFEFNDINIDENSDKWKIRIDVEKVYPNHTHCISSGFVLLSDKSHQCKIECTIVGDNIPMPIKSNLTINCVVTKLDINLDDIIKYHKKVSK